MIGTIGPRAWERPLRLWTGLVLVLWLLMHLVNHAAGVFGVAAMDAARPVLHWPWTTLPGQILLYGALGLHALLALVALGRRRQLAMPAWEALQILLGFAIPLLLIDHVVAIRGAAWLAEAEPSYRRLMIHYWVQSPDLAARQGVLLLIAWAHGMVGLHYWLRLKRWYRPRAWLLLVLAVLVPAQALTGFAAAGAEVAAAARADDFFALDVLAETGDPFGEDLAQLQQAARLAFWVFLGLALLTVAVGLGPRLLPTHGRPVRITYPGGRVVSVPTGLSVLEASRRAGIPHQSVCGGRARCSTCRVRIVVGAEPLPPPRAPEIATLARIRAEPDVRLACQLRPQADLTVVPLFAGRADGRAVLDGRFGQSGRELEVTVLFVDLRGSTTLAEQALPYDVIFIIDRYVRTVSAAVTAAGGMVTSVAGDGVMAIFGFGGAVAAGARSGMEALIGITDGIEQLNRDLSGVLPQPLRIGIGLHLGVSVVGEIGAESSNRVQFLGDIGNVVSRLEGLTKDYKALAVISRPVFEAVGVPLEGWSQDEVVVRGRSTALPIVILKDAAPLRAALGAGRRPAAA